ncbi:NAD-dependent epimerase/dehydratase family protein [soil metagenome]
MSKDLSNNTKDKNNVYRPVIGLVEWFRVGEYERVEEVLADIAQIGVTELRTGISWADYYSPQGKEWYDWLIPTLARQVKVLPCFLYTPPSLGLKPKTSSPPARPKDYADFLDVILTELGEHFEWVELWNEPNNKIEYDYTLDKHWFRFAEMVGGAAHWAQKRGKKTLLGGMSPVDPNWLQLMFDRGVMQYIDAVGIHGFPDVFDQQWEDWDTYVRAVREVLQENGSTAQVWITEAGFSTWQHDELKQLNEFKAALKAEVDKVYWYAARDLDASLPTVGGFHLDEREYHFGLKKSDGSPKLLYRLWAENGLDGLHELTCLNRKEAFTVDDRYALISGGAGFVGTNLAKRLLEAGRKVMILDNLSRPGVERNLQWLCDTYPERLSVTVASILDFDKVKALVRQADQVFHFAAQVAVTTSLTSPFTDFDINARGTLNLLEAIRLAPQPPSLVFSSTNKVYGGLEDLQFEADESRYHPTDARIKANGISESRPLDFHSPYGCSKGSADQYVLDYARTFRLPAVVFRMSCIYGPHQYGTEDQGWVAHFAIRAIEGKPISIYGDGKQVRDVLYVEDLVDAFLLAQEHMPQISGEAFNIGGGPGNTASLLEILKMLEAFGEEKIALQFGDWRPGDQHYYVSDIRKFRQATGWKPKNNVQQGVAKLYQWLCVNRGLEPQKDLQVPLKETTQQPVIA